MKRTVVIIPARYGSSRFEGKPLADVYGKSLVRRVWMQCCKAVPPDDIYIATDSRAISNHCRDHKMQVIMTSDRCKTGTDRVYEAARSLHATTIINVQGDEPMVDPNDIKEAIRKHNACPSKVFCGMAPIVDESRFVSPSVPKMVVDRESNLLYASRAAIPSSKASRFQGANQQVCVYAFSPENLHKFYETPKTPMESIEDIEILRFLEMGVGVEMINMKPTIAVDYLSDIKQYAKSVLSTYKTWFFDCDGVILDSNKLKTQAFYEVAKPYGEDIANDFVHYHRTNGGISRFEKFNKLWRDMLNLKQDGVDELVQKYGEICHRKLLQCNVTPGFTDFLSCIRGRKIVVSGSEEKELRSIFQLRSLHSEFDAIYGSPKNKLDIISELSFDHPAVLVGDSRYDYEVAAELGLSFIFMSGFTEFEDWEEYFSDKDVMIVNDMRCLE